MGHLFNNNDKGISNVMIEGTLLAQVVSSDATKNVPFDVASITDNNKAVDFIPNDVYTTKCVSGTNNPGTEKSFIKIPKDIIGFVTVGTYRISQSMQHMPLLLEQKVVRTKSKIQIAIQVSSKLSNPDDLFEFSVVVFIPEEIDGEAVSILTGDGDFNQWKRCIIWELEHLPKGRSFMVSAKCSLNRSSEDSRVINESLKFPVMLRCKSKDQISSTRFKAIEATGHPATVSSSAIGKSYRIVHRLN